jgi:Tfp pilus assembly protein PilV
MNLRYRKSESGVTLPELMITALVLGVFFASLFEVSAVCLRYISASKENITAVECVQDRIEQLRALDFTSLTNTTYLAVAPTPPPASPAPTPPQRRNLTTPANASGLAKNAIETVKISNFSGGTIATPAVTFVRTAGASINETTAFADTNIAPSITWSGGSTLSSATAVQVDVTYEWNAVMGGRTRRETSSTIVSAGTKK